MSRRVRVKKVGGTATECITCGAPSVQSEWLSAFCQRHTDALLSGRGKDVGDLSQLELESLKDWHITLLMTLLTNPHATTQDTAGGLLSNLINIAEEAGIRGFTGIDEEMREKEAIDAQRATAGGGE